MFRRLISLMAISSFIIGAAAAQELPVYRWQGYNWYSDQISFIFSPYLGDSVIPAFTPATTDTNVPGGAMPEQTSFFFERYNNDTQAYDLVNADLKIYTLNTLPTDQPINTVIGGLETVIALPDSDLPSLSVLPSVYQMTASQVLVAQVQHLNAVAEGNTNGIRYLTVGAHDVSPILNGQLVYNYLGFTPDKAYLVDFRFPIQTALLPDDIAADFNYDTFAASYSSYLADLTQQLQMASPDSFTPTLAELDAIASSVRVDSPAATFAVGQVDYEGIAFTVDAALADRVEVDTIPAYTAEESPMSGATPSYTQFTLANYAVADTFLNTTVDLYRVDALPVGQTADVVNQLRDLLATKPELRTALGDEMPMTLPKLPVFNAAQVFVVNPQYVTFAGGEGISFITYYAQGVDVVKDGDVFYAFIGLSSDNQTVISATFPLAAPFLPSLAELDMAATDYQAFADNYNIYAAQLVADLAALPADQFTPNLNTLQTLVSSFTISQ